MEIYKVTNLKSLYFKYSGMVFCFFIILLYVFTYNYAVDSLSLKVILICIYFAVASILLFGIYKSKGEVPNLVAVLLLPLLMIPMMFNPILLIPLIGVVFLYFRFAKWRIICTVAVIIFIILYSIIGFLCLLVYSLSNVFSGFGVVTNIKEISSPNGQYVLILQESDQGALGGSVSVFVKKNVSEKSFIGIVKRRTNAKELYYGRWSERPSILWLDNETVEIKGRKFNIYNYNKWDNYKT